jgi:TolB-like protein
MRLSSVRCATALFVVLAVAPRLPLAAQTPAPPAQPVVAPMGTLDSRPTVAVLYFTNGALVGGADYAPLSKGMAEILITELARNPGVRVVERDRLQQLMAEQNLGSGDRVDQGTALRLGKILGAHHLLMGGFVVDPRQNVRIDVRSVNTETSQVEYVETVTGKADRLLALVDELGTKLNTGLRLPPLPPRLRPAANPMSDPATTTPAVSSASGAAAAPPPSARPSGAAGPNQFRAAMLLSRALEAQDRGDAPGAVALLRQSLQANPEFGRARTLLAVLESPRPAPAP